MIKFAECETSERQSYITELTANKKVELDVDSVYVVDLLHGFSKIKKTSLNQIPLNVFSRNFMNLGGKIHQRELLE